MKLLIYSDKEEHCLRVENNLKQKGVSVDYFNSAFFEKEIAFTNVLSSTGCQIEINKHIKNEYNLVWFRKKIIPQSSTFERPIDCFIATEEYRTLLNYWFLSLKEANVPFFCSPELVDQADNKLWQLKKACQVGLKIPDTICSNQKHAVQNFINSNNNNCIAKAVNESFFSLYPDWYFGNLVNYWILKFLMEHNVDIDDECQELANTVSNLCKTDVLKTQPTKLIESHYIDQYLNESIIQKPCLTQEYIDKSYELRITIIGTTFLTAAIYSDDRSYSTVDWRYQDYKNLKHKAVELPYEIKKKLLNLMSLLSLEYACVDMIVNKDNEYIFLEANVCGAWDWVEDLTGLPIASTLSNYLYQKMLTHS